MQDRSKKELYDTMKYTINKHTNKENCILSLDKKVFILNF